MIIAQTVKMLAELQFMIFNFGTKNKCKNVNSRDQVRTSK